MRRAALLLLLSTFAAACAPPERRVDSSASAGERVARSEQRFTSTEAVLLDFEFDGRIEATTHDPQALQTLIEAQLLYSVGPLNADRALGRHERLELSAVTPLPDGSTSYHARLPVAWGGAGVPSTYELLLPKRVAREDQTAFAAKYGGACTDAEAGPMPIAPSTMFLFYRPRQAGCALDAADVEIMSAAVRPSAEVPAAPSGTGDRYPEYDRIWEDRALRVVAVFSLAGDGEAAPDDEGLVAYERFRTQVVTYLGQHGAVAPTAIADGRVDATLSDGRAVRVDVRLVDHDLAKEGPAFDTWFDAVTPDADLVVYSGHAGLGANVRSLMRKGTYRPGKYLMLALNGCDTFAYIDRTLAARRALLNSDDLGGTKYMDVVSNVMPGYFSTGADTSMTLIDALVRSTASYRELLAGLDPAQVAVVTGEEDNTFRPSAPPPPPPPAATPSAALPSPFTEVPTPEGSPAEAASPEQGRGCSSTGAGRGRGTAALLLGAVALLGARARRRRVHA